MPVRASSVLSTSLKDLSFYLPLTLYLYLFPSLLYLSDDFLPLITLFLSFSISISLSSSILLLFSPSSNGSPSPDGSLVGGQASPGLFGNIPMIFNPQVALGMQNTRVPQKEGMCACVKVPDLQISRSRSISLCSYPIPYVNIGATYSSPYPCVTNACVAE